MLKRILNFIARPIASPAIESLYRACVAQARQPVFYTEIGIPDSVDGRFDLLIFHVLLVILRLQDHTGETQQLFDILFADMDKNLREMGVSDISIAKKMKPMLAAFYGRAKAYEDSLAADDATLSSVLQRNMFGTATANSAALQRLTAYARHTQAALAAQPTDALLSGHIAFPKEI